MTSPVRVLGLVVAGLMLAAGVAVPVAPANADADGPPVLTGKTTRTKTSVVQHTRVRWKGKWKNPTYIKSVGVPGIGTLDLVCLPNNTMIRLGVNHRSLETQMWMQKFEKKNRRYVVAVKNARVYQYANIYDDGTGGTGFYTHEGLNKKPGVENRSRGSYMYGVISQRAGRNADGSSVTTRPVTTFEMTWNWNNLNKQRRKQSCTIDIKLTTHFDRRMSLTWHGEADGSPREKSWILPGIGRLFLSCPAGGEERPSIWLNPYTDDARLYIEDVEGEGLVPLHRTEVSLGYDDSTGLVGPYPLPSNGSLRIQATRAGNERWLMLSSLFKLNDPDPQRNFCEVATGYYDR